MKMGEAVREIKSGIYEVGVIDWDRRLFDELIPLPEGTSYNAYLIKGRDKIALIDTVDPPKTAELLRHLEGAGAERVDYVISHHGEQDHSGAIPAILMRYKGAKVVTNAKNKGMLSALLGVKEDKFMVMEDGDSLELGGKTLQFCDTPWVHWPETMVSYLVEDKVLFSCDFMGSHLASSKLFVEDKATVYEAAKRYYAEIMMPFRAQIRKNLEKIKDLPIEIIAPSHGPIHREPAFIMEAYKDWSSEAVKNEVVLAYVSMHGSTAKMAEYLTEALMRRQVAVKRFNLTEVDIGKIAIALVDAATVVVGTPTVLAGAHPAAAGAAYLVNALRPKTKFIGVFGSYGWGGKMVEQLQAALPSLKAEILKPVLAKGYPQEADRAALEELAEAIRQKHQELNLG